jgi:hypothetical protein
MIYNSQRAPLDNLSGRPAEALATSGKMRRKEKPKEKKAVAARGEGGMGEETATTGG